MKKRMLIIIISFIALFCFTACGKNPTDENAKNLENKKQYKTVQLDINNIESYITYTKTYHSVGNEVSNGVTYLLYDLEINVTSLNTNYIFENCKIIFGTYGYTKTVKLNNYGNGLYKRTLSIPSFMSNSLSKYVGTEYYEVCGTILIPQD